MNGSVQFLIKEKQIRHRNNNLSAYIICLTSENKQQLTNQMNQANVHRNEKKKPLTRIRISPLLNSDSFVLADIQFNTILF